MENWVVLLVVGVIAVAVIAIVVGHQANTRRREELQALARTHGWEFTERDDSLNQRLPPGPPFRGHPRRARNRNILAGTHRGRPFSAFEYSYTTTTSTGQTTSTTTHHYTVWTLTLPAALPSISLGAEGIFGGRVARAFGLGDIDIGDAEFDRRYKVRSDHAEYAMRLLHPAMVRLLMGGETWAWRIDGDVMLSYAKGRLQADGVLPRLDAMAAVLDQVPPEVWDR